MISLARPIEMVVAFVLSVHGHLTDLFTDTQRRFYQHERNRRQIHLRPHLQRTLFPSSIMHMSDHYDGAPVSHTFLFSN